jgi:DNA-binding transcriptional LysR family regulator
VVSLDGPAPRLHFVPLFTEEMVWVARPDNPLLAGGPAKARVAGARRIVISGYRDSMDGHNAGVGEAISRRSAEEAADPDDSKTASLAVGVTVPDAFSAVVIAGRSDMVALVPRRLAQIASKAGNVVMREPRRPSPPMQIGAVFRADRLAQPALAWFARVMSEVAKAL